MRPRRNGHACGRQYLLRPYGTGRLTSGQGWPWIPTAPIDTKEITNAGHDTRALQAWLGHKNIQHTVRYTELAPDRFNNFWR